MKGRAGGGILAGFRFRDPFFHVELAGSFEGFFPGHGEPRPKACLRSTAAVDPGRREEEKPNGKKTQKL